MANKIIIFVEGDTEEVLFPKIIDVYKKKRPECKSTKCDIINIKGIGNYKAKAIRQLKNKRDEASKKNDIITSVICCYDNDVFEFSINPPINWGIVKNELEKILEKPKVKLISIKEDIEDWLLADIDGLCKYLKAKRPEKLIGKTGFIKISKWFKTHNKIYSKGYDCERIIKHLNIELITQTYDKELKPIRAALGIKD